MQSKTTTSTKKQRAISVALTLMIGVFGQGLLSTPAGAQGYDAGQAGYLGQAQGLSPDQDSLLPPEVVPHGMPADISPAAPQQGMTMGASPGLLDSTTPGTSMNMNAAPPMTPQSMRRAAFESLMNQPIGNQMNQFTPTQGSTFGQSQPAPGGSFGAPLMDPQGGPFAPGQPGIGQLGQPDWLIMGNNKSPNANAQVSQTQTLTAGSKIPITRHDTRRGGAAHNISGFSSVGAGLLTGLVRRPNSLFGLGATGVMMTGFGVRNGFRF